MIYPQPMNLDYGYLAIKGKDKVYKVKANQPSVLIFDNNRLQHRAFSPRDSFSRLAIEISLCRVLTSTIENPLKCNSLLTTPIDLTKIYGQVD